MDSWEKLKTEIERAVQAGEKDGTFDEVKTLVAACGRFETTAELLAFQRDRENRDFETRDAVLGGLLVLAKDAGSATGFARCLAMLCVWPVLTATYRHYRFHHESNRAAISNLYDAVLDEIGEWPAERRKVAANFTLNVRRRVKAALQADMEYEIRLGDAAQQLPLGDFEETGLIRFWKTTTFHRAPLPSASEVAAALVQECRMCPVSATVVAERLVNKCSLREAGEKAGISHGAARHRWRTALRRMQRTLAGNERAKKAAEMEAEDRDGSPSPRGRQ
jgi:hypothetical protein